MFFFGSVDGPDGVPKLASLAGAVLRGPDGVPKLASLAGAVLRCGVDIFVIFGGKIN